MILYISSAGRSSNFDKTVRLTKSHVYEINDRVGVQTIQYKILTSHNTIQVLVDYPQTCLIMNYKSRQLTDIILELVCFWLAYPSNLAVAVIWATRSPVDPRGDNLHNPVMSSLSITSFSVSYWRNTAFGILSLRLCNKHSKISYYRTQSNTQLSNTQLSNIKRLSNPITHFHVN